MRRLLSGNDFCGGPEAMDCCAHSPDQLILSTNCTITKDNNDKSDKRDKMGSAS